MTAFIKIRISRFLVKYTPRLLKICARNLGLTQLFNQRFLDKYESELATAFTFGKEFEKQEIKDKTLEYWNTYRFLPEIKKIIAPIKSSKMLDVGCGIASILHFIDEGQKYAIDPLADHYKKIYHYPDTIKLETGVGENLPYPDSYFDIVFCTNVLDHVSKPKRTIEEMTRVLKKESYLVLTIDIHGDSHDGSRSPHHPHDLTEQNVLALIESPFEVVFKKETKFLGIKQYVLGMETKNSKELVIVARRK